MNTEPKMPLLPEPDGNVLGWALYTYRTVTDRDQQWAERVAELERVLDVARDTLKRIATLIPNDDSQVTDAIATIDAARSKEGG